MGNNVNMGLLDAMRASAVKRWQIVDVFRDQSLAEHTFGVMAIAMKMVEKFYPIMTKPDDTADITMEKVYRQREMMDAVMRAAMVHDLPEVVTGDIPTPTKKVMGLRKSLQELENRIYFCGFTYGEYKQEVRDIVVAADLLEAALYLQNYRNTQSAHANSVYAKILERMKEVPMAYAMFIELNNTPPLELDDMMPVSDKL